MAKIPRSPSSRIGISRVRIIDRFTACVTARFSSESESSLFGPTPSQFSTKLPAISFTSCNLQRVQSSPIKGLVCYNMPPSGRSCCFVSSARKFSRDENTDDCFGTGSGANCLWNRLASGSVPAEEQQQPLLGAAQLDQLVAPIALYPDPLLAQVLMASTYPLEVVQADRFAKTNKALKGDKLTQALDKQDWDASVKQLVSTPTVLAMMSDQLDWTEKLGDAVLAQQTDLMDAIQRLRGQAQANGKLGTTKQQKVTVSQEANKQVIEIEPASPEVVYVPYYNPSVVYGEWSYPDYPPYYYPPPAGYVVGGAIATGLAWGAAFAIGHEIWDNFDWDRGNINVNIDRNVNRNIDRNVNRNVDRNFQKWEHNSYHRRGVSYNSDAVKNKFSKGNARAAADRKLDYRGRKGDQVLNVGQGGQLGGGNRGERPNAGQGGQLGGGNRGERAVDEGPSRVSASSSRA